MSTHHPNFGRSSGIGNVFKSFTKSLKSSSNKNVPILINPTVIGGGSDQEKLFEQLKSGPLPRRASAASKITESLKKYSISSIPEIWYLARDMCDYRIQSYIRRITLDLLIECIKQEDASSVSSKLKFFQDIVHFCQLSENKIDPDYDLFLKAIRVLTNNGRDIHDFSIYDEDRNFNKFIEVSLFVLGKTSKYYTDKDTDETLAEDNTFQNLIETIRFTKNCLKFNFSLIDEGTLTSITFGIINIASQTSNTQIIANCLELLHSIVVFGNIPMACFPDLINFICSIYGLNDQLTDISWDLVKNLCVAPTSQIVLSKLCDIVLDKDLQQCKSMDSTNYSNILSSMRTNITMSSYNSNKEPSRPINTCLGAIQILEKLHIFCCLENKTLIDCSYVSIFKAAQQAISYNIPIINSAYLRSFDRLLSKEVQKELNSTISFENLLPFHLWYSNSFSLYDVLTSLKSNSEQDTSYWRSICWSLQELYENHELHTPKDKLVNFYMQNHRYLSFENVIFVLKYYSEEKLCSLLNPFWKENCVKILDHFYYNSMQSDTNDTKINLQNIDSQQESNIKLETLKVLKEAYDISLSIFDESMMNYSIIFELFRKSINEKDERVIKYLANNFLADIALKSSLSFFKDLCSVFMPGFQSRNNSERLKSFVSMSSIGSTSQMSGYTEQYHQFSPSFLRIITESIIRVFVISSTDDGAKAQEGFSMLIIICHYALANENTDLLLILSRCLIRLRITNENFVFFTAPIDMDGLATTFGRNTLDSNFKKQEGLKWVYPESLEYLPEHYFNKPSKNLTLFNPNQMKLLFNEDEYTIDISRWFTIVLEIMTRCINWEIYSYIWAHFCSQLSNMALYKNNSEQIIKLKTIVCDQLMLNLPATLSFPEQITKANLQVALVRTLSALLGYHDFFSKYDEDQILKALLFGLSSWEKTAIPCINILTICCYLIPLSIKKTLPAILNKLQTRITSAFASSHTLEFLMSLIHLPTLTSNFTIDEFKRVFAIAFKYIEYSNDLKVRKTTDIKQSEIIQAHGVDAEVEHTPTTQSTEITPILSEYLLALSYNVISSWFLKMNLNERRKVSSFLIRNLILLSNNEKLLDNQTLSYLDLIYRFTHSDLPLKIINPSKVRENWLKTLENSDLENFISTNTWISGTSIISIDTNTVTGESLITFRKPTGVSIFKINLDATMYADFKANSKTNSLRQVLNSNHILLQIFNTMDKDNKSKPLPLIEDPVTTRAISAFDRIPVVEFHKVGLMYIAPNQSEEVQILGNRIGSHDYQKFLDNIGRLIKLKNCKDIYIGGLDNENNLDGEYAVFWNDKTTQLIFHTATMMNATENDKYYDLKKKHIGNNYVNIYFDESGLPFNFNVIKSQFNFLNIVITPHTLSSSLFAGKRAMRSLESNPPTPHVPDGHSNSYMGSSANKYFKVKTYRRSGVPGVFATCHFKIISEDKLPIFIRNLAIVADLFASVWHTSVSGPYTSNWSHRVKQINVLKEKTLQNHQNLKEEQERNLQVPTNVNSTVNKNTTQAFLEQLQFDSNNSYTGKDFATSEPTSKYEYLAEDENELFSILEFNSYT